MLEEKLVNIPIISVSKTSGLTSANQLVDSTSNETFSFQDSTSKTGEILVVFYPSHEKRKVEGE